MNLTIHLFVDQDNVFSLFFFTLSRTSAFTSQTQTLTSSHQPDSRCLLHTTHPFRLQTRDRAGWDIFLCGKPFSSALERDLTSDQVSI
jgi:hypothetical protein